MMTLIENPDDERISEFKLLRNHSIHNSGHIIVEGERAVSHLSKANMKIFKLLGTESFFSANKFQIDLENILCYQVSSKVIKEIVGFRYHRGVIALAQKPSYLEIEDLDERIVFLNGLTSPENVGTIIRNSAAFNINSVIFDDKTCSPYSRRCIRVSMGHIFKQKIYKSFNVMDTILHLKSSGYKIVATGNYPHAINFEEASIGDKCVIIIGSEGHGIDASLVEVSDLLVKIEMNADVNNINAACASAILFYSLFYSAQ